MDWPPPNAETQNYKTTSKSGVGEQIEVRIAVRVKAATDFQRIDVRFLNKRFLRFRTPRAWVLFGWLLPARIELWYWENEIRTDIIEMIGLKENGKRGGRESPSPEREPNRSGGMRLHYDEPQRALAHEFLWFTAIVNVRQQWEGYIAFEAAMSDGRKARTRRKARFSIEGS